MPLVHGAVLGRILAHGRDHDAVLHRHAAQPEGGEHGWRRRVGRHGEALGLAHVCGEPAIDAGDIVGITQLQVLVGDALGAREKTKCVLLRLEAVIAQGVLVPLEAHHGRAL